MQRIRSSWITFGTLSVLLAGLGCRKVEYVTVPTPCPQIVLIPEPHLPISDYDASWDAAKTKLALYQSVAIAMGWGRAQQEQIRAVQPVEKKAK